MDLNAEEIAGGPEVQEVPALAGQGNAGQGRLNWTNVMSGFVLRRFCDLVAEGVRIDKGFKEVHLNAVARDLREFTGIDVTGTQVYNHLRKWCARWVKICKLKDLSGAGWDEENFVITLADDHYYGHIKDHPKDAEFLNVPLVNYTQMQTIYGSGMATGRFAMGSNGDQLGSQPQPDTIDLDNEGPKTSIDTSTPNNDVKPESSAAAGKRKRTPTSEEEHHLNSLTDAIRGFAAAVSESSHSEAAPGIYQAVMGCDNFSREALMFALGYLMDHKATALVFTEKSKEDQDLWLRQYLAKHYY
ncbi:hypothetical protein QOZ80_4BG0332590 [Eleusine coracana subsp. coracana]|nr:hypothetical protein QOZ80_4BG0332590 [Eleusine coracana subsp. coracana]